MNRSVVIALYLALVLFPSVLHADDEDPVYPDKDIGEFYDRLAADITSGKPLTITVYVALCDNDSQGIVQTKNKEICRGDFPENNIYWGTSGGLKGHLKTKKWKRVYYEKSDEDNIAVTGVWRKKLFAGGELKSRGVKGRIPVYIIGLGYRGTRIQEAMSDYLRAVSRDEKASITLEDGTLLEYGGTSHIVGYVGHNYFMDVLDQDVLLSNAEDDPSLFKGVFGLACLSDRYFRKAVQKRNTHILVLNKDLTYPSAFTIVGLVEGVAAGESHRGIHRSAARAFAKGQKRTVGTMLSVLSYGDKTPPKPAIEVKVKSRDTWGALSKRGKYRRQRIKWVTIHREAIENDEPGSVEIAIQELQKEHQKSSPDIKYHFIVDPKGAIYEGLPFFARGIAGKKRKPGSLNICFLQTGENEALTKPQERSLVELTAWAFFTYSIKPSRMFEESEQQTSLGFDRGFILESALSLLETNRVYLFFVLE